MSVAYATKDRTSARPPLAAAASRHLGPQTSGLRRPDQLRRAGDLLSDCGGRIQTVLEPEVLGAYWTGWRIGSGQTEAGKKWWPETTYSVESSEFRVEFRTNASGYRARPAPFPVTHPYRVAFVGDSFTEAMQVAYDSTFCARLERLLNQSSLAQPVVCENIGVSATDLLDYWHRIVHDVLAGDPPDALVLCIYPGNDFQGVFPDEAFDAKAVRFATISGTAVDPASRSPGSTSTRSSVVTCSAPCSRIGSRPSLLPSQGPKNWWADPLVAARAAGEPAVRRSRAMLAAIDEECRRRGTKLCILVVGPVANYTAKNGESPLGADHGKLGARHSGDRRRNQGASPTGSSVAHFPDRRPSQRGRPRLHRRSSGALPPRLPGGSGTDRICASSRQ